MALWREVVPSCNEFDVCPFAPIPSQIASLLNQERARSLSCSIHDQTGTGCLATARGILVWSVAQAHEEGRDRTRDQRGTGRGSMATRSSLATILPSSLSQPLSLLLCTAAGSDARVALFAISPCGDFCFWPDVSSGSRMVRGMISDESGMSDENGIPVLSAIPLSHALRPHGTMDVLVAKGNEVYHISVSDSHQYVI
jgi:hypothetical protein